MPSFLPLVAVLFPFFSGALLPLWKLKKPSAMRSYVFIITLLTSACAFMLILFPPTEDAVIIEFTHGLSLSFGVDGTSRIFAALVAFLWPLSTLYAFEYMKDDRFQTFFFTFYTITFGVTLGIAFAANLFTLFVFYEFMTLCTLPLVMHGFDKKSTKAGRKYMYYSLGGSAFAFIGLIFIAFYANTTEFTLGGLFTDGAPDFLPIIYFLTFMGFGVKAAVFPVHGWLPTAAVAPTPVTALLHAVAVVKAGAFAIIRITYFSFGAELLRGTWAQYTVMIITLFTIIYGSSMALRENHFKRRLAYSTVGNLSYILFAVSLMSTAGLAAALLHMLAHGLTKIISFFAAGAILKKTGLEYVTELDGLGKKMPFTCVCFTISALSLVGIPPFAGFISKWAIGSAALEGDNMGYIGLGALLLSALLTAVYMFTPVVRMFGKPCNETVITKCDPGWRMKVTLAVITAVIFLFGVFASTISEFITSVSLGG